MLLEKPATAWRASATQALRSSPMALVAARGVWPERAGPALHCCGLGEADSRPRVGSDVVELLAATRPYYHSGSAVFKALKNSSQEEIYPHVSPRSPHRFHVSSTDPSAQRTPRVLSRLVTTRPTIIAHRDGEGRFLKPLSREDIMG